MTLAALTWPQAAVYVAAILAGGLVAAVAVWSIFRTGQTAIRSESHQRADLSEVRADVDELRARLEAIADGR
jgi:cytochrome c-type biogenesis protein CcmH/NrfG